MNDNESMRISPKNVLARRVGKCFCTAALVLFVTTACKSSYDADVEPGKNGEPGSDLKRVYSREFQIGKADYFKALEAFYSFSQVNSFTFVKSNTCFNDVLDTTQKLEKSCAVLWAVTGAPTKAHMTFIVDQKYVNHPDRQDQLKYRIEIFVFEGYRRFQHLGTEFQLQVQPRLEALSTTIDSRKSP